jgi:CheY-like chemotaxis protein
MVATVLRDQGYKVLEAANGDEALHLVQKHNGEKIDLLVTDVVMPKIGGQELAQRLLAARPEIKVLYTSGYADGPNHTLISTDPGTDFLQKPYQPEVLAVKVREVLDR